MRKTLLSLLIVTLSAIAGILWVFQTALLGAESHPSLPGSYKADVLNTSGLQRSHLVNLSGSSDELLAGAWISQTVDEAELVGEFDSLALDRKNMPHVGYRDGTRGALKYAYQNNGEWMGRRSS